jgi:hypothetical protein
VTCSEGLQCQCTGKPRRPLDSEPWPEVTPGSLTENHESDHFKSLDLKPRPAARASELLGTVTAYHDELSLNRADPAP